MLEKIKNRAEAQKHRYGSWGGNPKGTPYDPKYCCEEVGRNQGGWTMFGQCQKKPGHGPDGLYCRIHEPEYEKNRRAERDKKDKERWDLKFKPYKDKDSFLEALRKIAKGHNDPRTLAEEVLKERGYDVQETQDSD